MGCAGSKESEAKASAQAVAKDVPDSSAGHPLPTAATTSTATKAGGEHDWSAEALLASARGGAPCVSRLVAAHACGSSRSVAIASMSNSKRGSRRAWADAVGAAFEVIWSPLIDGVERSLDAADGATWDSLGTGSLHGLFSRARGAGKGVMGQWEHAAASELLLGMSAVLRRGGPDGDACDVVESASMRRLLALLSLALCRVVAVESAHDFGAKLERWRAMQVEFGLPRPELCAVLGGAEKGVLLYVDAAARGEGSLRVECQRERALPEALAQWESSSHASADGSVKLFPRFGSSDGGWESGEGHGPRKELFRLIGEQMLGEGDSAAFAYRASSRHHWFDATRERSAPAEKLLRFCGWVMAQAACNRAPLGVALPPLLFEKLLRGAAFTPTMAHLEQFDPQAAQSLRAVSAMSDAEVAEVASLDDADGPTDREGYVRAALDRLLVADCRWQFDALCAGFSQALPPALLAPLVLSPAELATCVCGAEAASASDADADFDIRRVFRVAMDDELRQCAPLAAALWRVLDAWPPARKRMLLKFSTGSDRLPAAGTEVLSVSMPFPAAFSAADHATMAATLPQARTRPARDTVRATSPSPSSTQRRERQAHTCDNVLELPNYYSALCAQRGVKYDPARISDALDAELHDLIDSRFCLAIDECAAYGLDENDAPRAPPPPEAPTATTTSAARREKGGDGYAAREGDDGADGDEVALLTLDEIHGEMVDAIGSGRCGSTPRSVAAPKAARCDGWGLTEGVPDTISGGAAMETPPCAVRRFSEEESDEPPSPPEQPDGAAPPPRESPGGAVLSDRWCGASGDEWDREPDGDAADGAGEPSADDDGLTTLVDEMLALDGTDDAEPLPHGASRVANMSATLEFDPSDEDALLAELDELDTNQLVL